MKRPDGRRIPGCRARLCYHAPTVGIRFFERVTVDDANEPRPHDEGPPANACFRCGTDYGSVALPRIAGLPVCDACARFFRERPFPAWIKGSLAALLLLAILAFLYNQRFFLAHVEMQRGFRALEKGDLDRAVSLLDAAAARVPEEPELRALARYYDAILLLNQDRSADAIPLLKEALAIRPDDSQIALALLHAESGLAYDQKDYEKFLEIEQTMAKRQPDDPMAALGVASAHACRYAATGDEAHRTLAERQIETASKMKGAEGPEFAEYLDRIRYRLESREIISLTEYKRRFPNGRSRGGPGASAPAPGGGG